MAGGLMQLVAYGSQDIYITGNPQITFFKIVYRRHTNFAIETVEQQFVGEPSFDKRFTINIPKTGDLITKMYVRVILNQIDPRNNKFGWTRRLGHALLKQVNIEIGGSVIDSQYGTWLDVWYELARKGDHELGYLKMIGDVPEMTDYNSNIKPSYVLYIPLQFWFNKFIGLAIPLIALQYHNVVLHVTFEKAEKLIINDCNFDKNSVTMQDASLLVNYVYLDADERRRFAQVGHEYLIEQIQFNGVELLTNSLSKYVLDYNFPTKELIWTIRNGNFSSGKTFVYYTNEDTWSMEEASKLIIEKSISIGINPESQVGGTWTEIGTDEIRTVGTFNVKNNNQTSIFVNPNSLRFDSYGITDKITANIIVELDGTIVILNLITLLTIRDLSIPLEYAIDSRYNPCDPRVNIFNNYGMLIDGTINPVEWGLIHFNGYSRFDQREGMYFNYVQPFQHHTNSPKDGINVYSFALFPEEHQPSGTANLSRIETTTLTLTIKDLNNENLPDLHYLNLENELYIFGLSYNIFRIMSGISGIAYS